MFFYVFFYLQINVFNIYANHYATPPTYLLTLQPALGGVTRRISATSGRPGETSERVRRSSDVLRHQTGSNLRHVVRQRGTTQADRTRHRQQRPRLGELKHVQ